MNTYVKFEDYPESRVSPTIGPFKFLQERYGEIVDPDGGVIAVKERDKWLYKGDTFSDVVFFSQETAT